MKSKSKKSSILKILHKMRNYLIHPRELNIYIPFNNLNYKSKSVITTLISRVALFLKNNFEVLPSEETLVDIFLVQ